MILFSFPSAEKKTSRGSSPRPWELLKTIKNNRITITAASDAMKGSGLARVVIAAPSKAEDRLGKVCERTICGSFETSISNHNHHPSFRTCQFKHDVSIKYEAWRNLLNRTGISSWTDSFTCLPAYWQAGVGMTIWYNYRTSQGGRSVRKGLWTDDFCFPQMSQNSADCFCADRR